MRLPITFPPKSSTAICAAATEPRPLRSEYRPVISVSTPILTTPSDTCAPANDVVTNSAAALEIARTRYLAFINSSHLTSLVLLSVTMQLGSNSCELVAHAIWTQERAAEPMD